MPQNPPPPASPNDLQTVLGQAELQAELDALAQGDILRPRIPIANTPETQQVKYPRSRCTSDKRCLRMFDSSQDVIAFIHIGKAGGTSFDSMLAALTT